MVVEVKDDDGGKQGGVLLTFGGVHSPKRILVAGWTIPGAFERDVIYSIQEI